MSVRMRFFLSFVLVFLAMATDPRAGPAAFDPNAIDQAAKPADAQNTRKPLVNIGQAGADASGGSGSLFAGQSKGGLFEPILRQVAARRVPNFGVVGLKNLIASAEAGKAQYNAVVFSARIKPPKLPTRMTIQEVYDWIDATPGQNHAIGRYQFIPSTLRMLVKRAKLSRDTTFDEAVQDQLALMLLEDAGLKPFLAGELSQTGFMNNLAKVWAGLPNSTGKSHYHGFAGNKAVISWATFEAAMNRYFPSSPSG